MAHRLLTKNDFTDLYDSFRAAFSENFVKLQPTKEEFSYRLAHKLRVVYEISGAAFDGSTLLGFIIHTSNIYEGIPTAYNGGTGVLPGFRNQKIAEELYEYLIPKIQSKFLARVLLEVVEVNEHAIKLYEKVGFNFRRRLLCFKQTLALDYLSNAHKIEEGFVSQVDFNFNDFEPSFLDSEAHLKDGNEKVLLCKINDELAGFAIFQPHLGRISQLSVIRKHRGKKVAKSLLYEIQKKSSKKLTIMNIPEDQLSFHQFLIRNGFINEVNQFEMELII
ncbi:MAG: GNAT family N-acetyltransferase [Bacteroidota bacterium]